ncbi:MAG: hypothetical protein KAT43_04700 [Nanoarchaeota archaeon]|nr:hypothetical protein [Nanoarchaeota archaeon]
MIRGTKHTFVCSNGSDFGKLCEFELEEKKPVDFLGGQLVVNSILTSELVFKKTDPSEVHKNKELKLRLNEEVGPSPENDEPAQKGNLAYRLIQSDLFPPNYSGCRGFDSITSIFDYDEIDQRNFNKLIEFLDPIQDRIIREVAGSFEEYVRMHLTDPIATIRKQNKVLDKIVLGCVSGVEDHSMLFAFYSAQEGKDVTHYIEEDLAMVAIRSINRDIFKSAVKLNSIIEKVLYKRFKRREAEYYNELTNVEYIVENDISPGEHFILGVPETYSRFIGLFKKYRDPMMREFLGACKCIAVMKSDGLSTAVEIMRFMHLSYSEGQAIPTPAGVTMTLGRAFEKGGNCSTRAPTLQLGLQEAGIRSRYCRGRVRGGQNRHAWVEADVFEDGSYALIMDPNKEDILIKGTYSVSDMYLYEDEKRIQKDYFNKLWRPKLNLA